MNMPITIIFKRSAIILSLLLAACAHAPGRIAAEQPASAVEPAPLAAVEQEEEAQPKLPNMELNGSMLYDFLLGEIAAQRGDQELAMQLYMDLANSTQDPRVARRAAQFALDARQMDKSVEALNLWLKLEPTSHQAKQMLVVVLLSGGKIEEARPYLEQMLAAYPDRVGHTFTQVYSLLLRSHDREAVYQLLADLTQPYPRVAEGHMALAQAAAAAGKREEALKHVRQARILRPEWEMAAMFEAQLLQRESPQQALALLKDYLATYPDADDARLLYARMLLEQKQNSEARTQFQHLLGEHPESADLAYAVAMISLEMGELDRAESELRQALAKGKKDDGTVYYYLGRLNEEKQRDAEALQNYQQVKGGDYVYDARLRVAYLLFKAGKLEEAREYLHQTAAVNNQQRVQLWLVEAELLRDSKQIEAALQVLALGMEKLPNHPDLLYEAGMLDDQLGRHDQFEQMMRRVIEINPEHAQAYNALGYSMLDRNERIPEAMQLVEKAIQLAPDDAGIIDSVGWGYYRQGNLDKSLEYLRRAYSTDPDPEIGAHLGEVLWVHGEKDQAKKIWSEALKLHPDNEVLQAAMKKFVP
jgi:tetratricopeptide (TPR) repeat protein